jgi:hypothetical protein
VNRYYTLRIRSGAKWIVRIPLPPHRPHLWNGIVGRWLAWWQCQGFTEVRRVNVTVWNEWMAKWEAAGGTGQAIYR